MVNRGEEKVRVHMNVVPRSTFSLPRVVPCFPLLELTPSELFMGLSCTLIYASELILFPLFVLRGTTFIRMSTSLFPDPPSLSNFQWRRESRNRKTRIIYVILENYSAKSSGNWLRSPLYLWCGEIKFNKIQCNQVLKTGTEHKQSSEILLSFERHEENKGHTQCRLGGYCAI